MTFDAIMYTYADSDEDWGGNKKLHGPGKPSWRRGWKLSAVRNSGKPSTLQAGKRPVPTPWRIKLECAPDLLLETGDYGTLIRRRRCKLVLPTATEVYDGGRDAADECAAEEDCLGWLESVVDGRWLGCLLPARGSCAIPGGGRGVVHAEVDRWGIRRATGTRSRSSVCTDGFLNSDKYVYGWTGRTLPERMDRLLHSRVRHHLC